MPRGRLHFHANERVELLSVLKANPFLELREFDFRGGLAARNASAAAAAAASFAISASRLSTEDASRRSREIK
eukprot:CAMPEP_0180106808 /NCGR_PEP_ID=MMETSP0985-20121206/32902_1 /TAXON_ID=483367 /ORGANISM="non described non described, Strain CCMP 2436" /LENGTH=72 /DNA_ID=CAMNT_0022044181 /DNA_START=40 /DNA_END=258 /DNA_ORIENTATION=-